MRLSRMLAAIMVVFALLVSASACAQPSGQEVVEDTPAPVGVDASSRVVALSRSVGELWLLSGGQLVGVTDDAFDLAGLSPDAVSVGSVSKPNVEQIIALEPDLVMLGSDLSAHREAAEALEAAGIAVLMVDVNSFDDYARYMDALTTATGRRDLYGQYVTDVVANIEQITSSSSFEGTYLAIRTSSTKNKVLKADYFLCDMLTDLGLSNIADDTSALDDLSLEAIAEADPEWVFVVLQGADDEALEAYRQAFETNPVWSELTAVREGHVVILPKDLFQYKPNARWDEAYEYLARVLAGEGV